MKKPVKSAFCHEKEKCLNSADRVPPSGRKSLITTYGRYGKYVRKIRFKGLHTFVDLCSIVFENAASNMQGRNEKTSWDWFIKGRICQRHREE